MSQVPISTLSRMKPTKYMHIGITNYAYTRLTNHACSVRQDMNHELYMYVTQYAPMCVSRTVPVLRVPRYEEHTLYVSHELHSYVSHGL